MLIPLASKIIPVEMQPKKNYLFFFFEIWQVFPSKKGRNMRQNIPFSFLMFFRILCGKEKKLSWQDQHFLLIIEKDRSRVPSVGATKMAGPPETRLLT
jgi:hypothetical protein